MLLLIETIYLDATDLLLHQLLASRPIWRRFYQETKLWFNSIDKQIASFLLQTKRGGS